MAISRHDPEWQHTIATAYLAGVRFIQIATFPPRYRNGACHVWAARAADTIITSYSKIAAARKALEYLAGKGAPDAAFCETPELMEQTWPKPK